MKLVRDSGSIERGGWRVTRDQHASNPHSPKLEMHPASRSSTNVAFHAKTQMRCDAKHNPSIEC